MMLSLFSNLLVKESDRRVIDNLCAALCRMIMSHMEGVPLEQVLECGMLAKLKVSITALVPIKVIFVSLITFVLCECAMH